MKKFFTSVDSASNGAIALAMLKEGAPYDVVLSDVRMPKMSGWELAQMISSLDKGVFIALMTGSPEMDGGDMEHCDIYLAKPLDLEKMQVTLEAIIKKKGL